MVNHILGEYDSRDLIMVKYLQKVKELLSKLSYCKIERVLRVENQQANALSKLASSSLHNFSISALVETFPYRIIKEEKVMNIDAYDREEMS